MADDIGTLVGAPEIQTLLNVSRQRLTVILSDDTFPVPAADLAQGKVWFRQEVEEWDRAQKHAEAERVGTIQRLAQLPVRGR